MKPPEIENPQIFSGYIPGCHVLGQCCPTFLAPRAAEGHTHEAAGHTIKLKSDD